VLKQTPGGRSLIRQIAAVVFIFICTTIAWMILAATISSRATSSALHQRAIFNGVLPDCEKTPDSY
jgi:hypothetical protein